MSSGPEESGERRARVAGFDAPARRVLAAMRGIRRPLVLVDGPSGSGKSTFADVLTRAWPGRAPALVRLDDVYPGWNGLDAARHDLSRTLVAPWRRGAPARYGRWDWVADARGATGSVAPATGLLVEGCGAFGVADTGHSAVRIWIEAREDVRRPRALTRDAGAFDPFWELWDGQWRAYLRRCDPKRHATIRVRSN
ncbi:ATP-binding protein [Agromyces sp. Marseille-Q5079]|uniref:ATP-binding protein n=1 Tax=Agromyces sp. Marseille-Q5079 TaxID=3439059 RepID=UPI003D9C7F9E